MNPQLTRLYLTAHRRRTRLFFLYLLVVMLAASVFAPIAEAGGGVREY
jgi:hypothetical protein